MSYEVEIKKQGIKFLKTRSENEFKRIVKAIYKIPEGDIKPMQGYENRFRLRVGDIRVIYRIDNNIITVILIGNRGDIY